MSLQKLDWRPMCLLQVGFSTSLGLLQRNGADIDKFMGILRGSALYAPTFDKKLQRMLDRDYANPNFPTKVRYRSYRLIVSTTKLLPLLHLASLHGAGPFMSCHL